MEERRASARAISAGRPRKACSTCNAQKIRCTGERPTCRRCVRLNHNCVYGNRGSGSHDHQKTRRATHPRQRDPPGAANVSTYKSSSRAIPGPSVLSPPLDGCVQDGYLGIPKHLISELVDTYFENVCNAPLLLHKSSFLQLIQAGTAAPHILLSVCAFGANFYRDHNGHASLKTQGFMAEWAQRAGMLAFQEIENFSEDLVVTFLNLTLFWHSQGSWRVSSLYKANAFHFLCIHGIGETQQQQQEALSWASEIQRRRFWAWYVYHCHGNERSAAIEPIQDIQSLPLPWREEDYAAGYSTTAPTTLVSSKGSTSIFAELVKVLTIWSCAVNLIKSPQTSLAHTRVTEIHSFHEKVSLWWHNLPAVFKLTPDSIATVQRDDLPQALLANLVYHQTLCVLHASIVPLFCWTVGDDGWAAARHLSAQVAYEHARSVSALIDATLSSFPKLSAIPSFVAYAAYGGCAILIPFMWSSNSTIRKQAQANVRTNLQMIHVMAEYWKFAALLTIHVRCLYNIHKSNPPALENEPKYINIRKLTEFRVEALYARVSILEFLGILQKGSGGVTRPGEETTDLGISQGDRENSISPNGYMNDDLEVRPNICQQVINPDFVSNESTSGRLDLSDLMQSQQWNLIPPSSYSIDAFQPIMDMSTLELPDYGITNMTQSELNFGDLDIDGWNNEFVSLP